MKKQMKWLIAALALAALATPAFAVTADMTGSLSVRGLMTNNFDADKDVNDHNRFADQRLRLFTNIAANENVKAVIGFEVDNVWGSIGTDKNVGKMGADATTQLEIKHLYLDFKIPALGANVKAGTQPFNFGRGLIINDDAAGLLVSMPCKVNPNNKLELSWIKVSENVSDNGNDDGDFYGAKYSVKAGDVTIAPYAGYFQSAQDTAAPYGDLYAAFYGIDVDGKSGAVGYALTAISNQWSRGGSDSGQSVSLYGKGTYAMGNTTLSLEAASYGDEDFDQYGNSVSLAQSGTTGPIVNFSEILTGGQYTSNNTGYDANADYKAFSTGATTGATTLYSTNWQFLKVGAVHKLSDKSTVSGYLMHVQQAEDNFGEARTIGQEIDTYFDYAIIPGLGLNVAAAYLMIDNEITDLGTDGSNAYKLATSLNYKF